jgi:hypothetical protein
VAVFSYLILGEKILRPFIVTKVLLSLPLSGDSMSILYFLRALYAGMLYRIDVKLRKPGIIFGCTYR